MKYPSTPHLPWSPNKKSDKKDRIIKSIECFHGKGMIYLEKLDGENTVMSSDSIHARSEDSPVTPWRTCTLSMHSIIKHKIPKGMFVCAENMYATHSIEYTNLKTILFVFGVFYHGEVLSWEDVIDWSNKLGLDAVPRIYPDVNLVHEMPIPDESELGGECEGYVVRNIESFNSSDFLTNIAKCVRLGHVQTDEHWTKNWVKANLTEDPIARMIDRAEDL